MGKHKRNEQPPYEWYDSQGHGLTIDEMDDLAHALVDNVERIEHEQLNEERNLRYLEWGKFLVDREIVTDWPKEGPDHE